jgi:prepilin-type N-terminal cleavage/methylation domain-containing protein
MIGRSASCLGVASVASGHARPRQVLRARGGFTMIEVMISLVFLSLVLLGAAGLMSGVASGTRNSQGNTLGAEILQQEVEILRSLPFDHADLAAGSHSRADGAMNRTIYWTVVNDVPDELKRVDLKVVWREASRTRELGFRLHLANRTPE